MTAEDKTETAAESEQILTGHARRVTVTATKPPALLERAKVATQIAVTLMIPRAAGWIIYKFKT